MRQFWIQNSQWLIGYISQQLSCLVFSLHVFSYHEPLRIFDEIPWWVIDQAKGNWLLLYNMTSRLRPSKQILMCPQNVWFPVSARPLIYLPGTALDIDQRRFYSVYFLAHFSVEGQVVNNVGFGSGAVSVTTQFCPWGLQTVIYDKWIWGCNLTIFDPCSICFVLKFNL